MTEMTTNAVPRPPFDAQLADVLAGLPPMPPLSETTLPMIRPFSTAPVEPLLESRAVERREFTVTSRDGAALAVTVISPEGRPTPTPAVLWLHGGGMVMGDRFSQIDLPLEWLDQFGVVVVAVEYRLAPEANGQTLVHDAYDALLWLHEQAAGLGVDPTRIIVAGTSAGGGIAAGVTLLARDRGAPAIAGQVLICPMLDHRGTSASSHQFAGPGVWSRESNEYAWSAVLADTAPGDVPIYVSPSTATDLSALPPTFLDAGSAEVFRDEVVDYASRIWAAGGDAELHLWAGGFHGFDALHPAADLSQSARETRIGWLGRLLKHD